MNGVFLFSINLLINAPRGPTRTAESFLDLRCALGGSFSRRKNERVVARKNLGNFLLSLGADPKLSASWRIKHRVVYPSLTANKFH